MGVIFAVVRRKEWNSGEGGVKVVVVGVNKDLGRNIFVGHTTSPNMGGAPRDKEEHKINL